jgi:integrase
VSQPKTPKPEKGHAYSVEESFAILNAIQRTDGTLLFALCAFEGLRPSEAAGLKWEDIDSADQYIVVTQAVVSGVAGGLKTEDTRRRLLLIEPVRSLIGAWRKQCGGASTGYLFHGRSGRPLNTNSFAKHVIIPDLRAASVSWHGLYAGRRGVGTRLTDITGELNAAYATLGNSYEVVAKHYAMPLKKSSDAGLKRLEQEHAK